MGGKNRTVGKCVFVLAIAGSFLLGAPRPRAAEVVLLKNPVHLRSGDEPEWAEYENSAPDSDRLALKFDGAANDSESVLFVQQDDVRHNWNVELNGQRLARLLTMEADLVFTVKIPGGTLRDGENLLSINPPSQNDDVFIRDIRLVSIPEEEALAEAGLSIRVVDEETWMLTPCRITIVNENGALAALKSSITSRDPDLAIRPGVVYTGDGIANISLRHGNYTVYASRGPEFSVATNIVHLRNGETAKLELSIRPEVSTPGWVGCDTHVHTFTHSRHGDATMNERMLTLAGEGIELPVSTDHNLHIDYSDSAITMNVDQYFTPITGNEVTTAKGHFNIFPTIPNARVPDFRVTDWPRLMEILRGTPDVKVVVLNHPRNVHNGFQPFASTNFNSVTGENLRGFEFSFDAMEVLNSSAQQSDYMLVYRDWFALLNYGHRIVAVGSSDGHDVSRYIVGQGRTYIRSPDEHVGNISVDSTVTQLLEGRALVSMGLIVDMSVNERFQVGDLATGIGDEIEVRVDVQSPGWISATNVVLFANGVKIRERSLTGDLANQSKIAVEWKIPSLAHDVHLVAIATGPGVTAPYWAIPRPYQPSLKEWTGRVIGSTNPIWIDADADDEFTAARMYARRLVDFHGSDPAALIPVLENYDEMVAAQAASLCQAAGSNLTSKAFNDVLKRSAENVQRGFTAFMTVGLSESRSE